MAVTRTQATAAAAGIAAVLTAAGIAADQVTIPSEGWVLTGYGDPAYGAKLATACAGVTKGVELGRKYTDADCRSRTAQALIEHGFAIAPYLPEELPPKVRAAFTDFAYNKGVAAFRGSGAAAAARAGDLKLACRRINQADDGHAVWVYAGRPLRVMPGLVKRMACDRALCEDGLTGGHAADLACKR